MIPLVPVILGTVAMLVSAQLLLKSGMTAVGAAEGSGLGGMARSLLAGAKDRRVIAGFCTYALSAAAWVYVLSRAELTYAFPFLALGYVGVLVGAVGWLGERPSRPQWAGIALVVAGVTLVAMSG